MPYSIVLSVFPEETFDLRQATGERLQAMLLRLLHQADPALAAELHDRPDQAEPSALRHYSVSPIYVESGNEWAKGIAGSPTRILGGMPCWLRVAAVDDRVYPALLNYLLGMKVERRLTSPTEGKKPDQPSRQTDVFFEPVFPQTSWQPPPSRPSPPGLDVGTTRFQIVEVLASEANDHPWVKYASWQELVAQASDTERRITLRFRSPTVFMQGALEFPLPVPRLVWKSLSDRWSDAFAHAYALPEDFVQTVEQRVAIARFDIRTQPFRQSEEITLTGCVGRVTYRIVGDAAPEFVKAVNLLADFALFSGAGKKTTRGMGMVRRIRERGARRSSRGQGDARAQDDPVRGTRGTHKRG